MRIGSISGSLQRLVNDTSYLVAGTNVTIASGSNGQVTISSTGGGGGGGGYEQAFNSSDLTAGILSVTHGLPDDYVHVSVYDDTDHQVIPNEVIITGVGTLDIDLSSFSVPASPDWHVFITSANASLGGGTPASPNRSVQFNNAGAFGGSANFTYDGKLSLTGSLIQFNTPGDTVGFMGDEPSTAPSTVGPDVFFYVSGSKGGKDSSTPGVAVFGGDVVISGTLHGGSPLKIGSDVSITGSLQQGYNLFVTGSGAAAFGSGSFAVNNYVHVEGSSNFAANVYSVITAENLVDNALEVVDASLFNVGDKIAYVYYANGNNNLTHITEVTSIDLVTNAVTASSIVSIDYSSFNALSENVAGDSVLFNLSQKSPANTFAHAEGSYTIASGLNSHAEGRKTAATGNHSHAEGAVSLASGLASHAEGSYTVASGPQSHAEGNGTTASGNNSHAEGDGTTASGYSSHAEGQGTIASGNNSHAEGEDTAATGVRSHAEGNSTTASGDYSHAEGDSTTASGIASHAEGDSTTASGIASHAEGGATTASGLASHAEGYGSIAEGDYSHAEGYSTRADGEASHAEGFGTSASGSYSHAGGYYTIASGSAQTAIGKYNLRDNDFSLFVVGNGTGDSNGARSDAFRVNVDSTQISGSLWQTNSGSSTIGFMGNDGGSPEAIGTDVFFFVSGSSGSMGTSVRGVAAFGGDVIVSGALKIGTGSIFITSDFIQLGNADHKITKSGNDLVFYDVNVPGGATLSSLIGGSTSPASPVNSIQYNAGGTFGGSSNFTYDGKLSLTGSLVQFNGAGDTVGFMGDQTSSTPASIGSDVFFFVSGSASGSASEDKKIVFGGDTVITGSLSQGAASQANGAYSHAEGIPRLTDSFVLVRVRADGAGSHAEGMGTQAIGQAAHAEGRSTTATADYSHAEGDGTQTTGQYSHAEGRSTISQGDYSHAEGSSTVSVGSYSHAEGVGTIASGSFQHAEGKYNKRGNTHSLLVIGNGTGTSDSNRSDIVRVETNSVQMTGSLWQMNKNSSTVGFMGNDSGSPEAIGTDVFFFVSGSQSSKDTSVRGVALFGGDVVISGTLHGGSPLKVSGSMQVSGSFAQGTNSLTIGADSHAEGYGSVAGAFGFIATVTTPGLIVLDPSYGDVTALFDPSIAWEYIVLQDSQYDDIYSSEVFKVASAAFNSPSTEITLVDSSVSTSTAIVGPQWSIIPSGADYVMGEYSHAEGVAQARGPYSHAEGQGGAAGMYSHAEGGGSAYGSWSHAEGYDTAARGQNSHAEGIGTIAYGAGSHTAGLYTITVGNFSHAGGERTIASGSAQAAIGKYNLRDNDFSLFVVGNGTGDSNGARSDAFRVNVDSTQVTGSFFQINSGSSTVGFMGAAGGSPATIGNDVFFFVSGSSGSLGTSTRGVALFGGDVRVSGSLLVGTGSVRITSNEITFANSAKIIQRNAGNISLQPSSLVEVTGSMFATSVVHAGNYYAGSVEILNTTPATAEVKHFYVCRPPSDPQTINVDDGRVPGQIAYFTNETAAGVIRITPANTLGSWTRIDLTKTVGASATFVWTGSAWAYMGGYLATPV